MTASLWLALVSALSSSCSSALSSLPIEPLAEPSEKISRGLQHLLAAGDPDQTITVMVDLRDQLDLESLAARYSARPRPRRQRGAEIRRMLARVADRSDRTWKPLLEELRSEGIVQSWSRLTIVNRLVITGRSAMVPRLARHPEVVAIVEQILGRDALLSWGSGDTHPVELWPIDTLGAAALHERGIDGRGIVIGVIDSGASDQHETLRENFRGGKNSWFDPLHNTAGPRDSETGHGTSVLSCAAGRAVDGSAFGVAPGARWIAAVGLDARRYHNVALAKAADWMLNTGQPDVLIAPWRLPEECDPSLRRIVNAWRMAGILVVFAAGNGGPKEGTDVAPANYTKLLPDGQPVLSVGAISSDLAISEQSSRGPSQCGTGIFPQLVAPGAGVPVAFPLSVSSYRRVSGTSFAAGYAAGAAALLMQRFPDAPVELLEEALRETAIDLGVTGADSVYGHGLPSVSAAIRWVESRSHPLRP